MALDNQGSSPASADAFIEWARRHALPLHVVDSTDDGDLAGVADSIANARIVALGEPAHGAHEPLGFRNRLFRYLVTHHGFTAIALETGCTEARRIDDFVLG